jgi:hypothetical protein
VAGRVITGVAEAAGASPPDEVRRLLALDAVPADGATAATDRFWLRTVANLDQRRS